MNLSDYLSGPEISKSDFARRVGIARQYLHKLAVGLQKPSPALARAFEKETGGVVTKEELRPDIWPPAKKGARA